MRDADVRKALYAEFRLQTLADPSIRVVAEMGLWSGSVRVDAALIGDDLHGYEIKSDTDTLSRLPAQSDIYGMVFDRMTIVCGTKHTDKVLGAIPGWWGVTEARMEGGEAILAPLREPTANPSPSPERIAGMLWKDEALALLSANGLPARSGSRIVVLHATLAGALPLAVLRDGVRSALMSRNDWLCRHDPLFIGPRTRFEVTR